MKSCLGGRHVCTAQSSLPGLSLLGNPNSEVEEGKTVSPTPRPLGPVAQHRPPLQWQCSRGQEVPPDMQRSQAREEQETTGGQVWGLALSDLGTVGSVGHSNPALP